MMSECQLSCFGSGVGRKAEIATSSSSIARSLAAAVQNDRANEVEATGNKDRAQGRTQGLRGIRRSRQLTPDKLVPLSLVNKVWRNTVSVWRLFHLTKGVGDFSSPSLVLFYFYCYLRPFQFEQWRKERTFIELFSPLSFKWPYWIYYNSFIILYYINRFQWSHNSLWTAGLCIHCSEELPQLSEEGGSLSFVRNIRGRRIQTAPVWQSS